MKSSLMNILGLLQLRGDPDGCGGLDASDSGPLRKGWLLKQVNNVRFANVRK